MSNGLLDEAPLLIMPSLAVKIGLNESILLQQVHYWLQTAKKSGDNAKLFEDRWWTYNSIPQWRRDNFPFWSERTIQRIIKGLIENGLITRREVLNDGAPGGVQIWYSIDYAVLELANTGGGDKLSPGCGQLVTTFTETSLDTLSDALPKSGKASVRAPADKPKKPRPRNPLFDMVAFVAFDIPIGDPVGDGTAGRVGKILAEMKTNHGGVYPAVETIRSAADYRRMVSPTTHWPNDPAKFDAMVREYERRLEGLNRSSTPPPDPDYDSQYSVMSKAELDAIADEMFGFKHRDR